MDIGQFASLAGSLKTAGDIAKAMIDLRDAQAFQLKAIELTREIMSAQQSALAAQLAQSALIEEVRNLKEQHVRLEAWAAEKQRYELTDHGCGTFTRTMKPSMANGEPPHRICAQCYERGRKGFLQSDGKRIDGREMVRCSLCHAETMLGCPGPLPTTSHRGNPWPD